MSNLAQLKLAKFELAPGQIELGVRSASFGPATWLMKFKNMHPSHAALVAISKVRTVGESRGMK